MARFASDHEVIHPDHPEGDYRLCFQWGRLIHDDKSVQTGYRFIWRRPNGSIQARGPARIPSLKDIDVLVSLARQQGWAEKQGD